MAYNYDTLATIDQGKVPNTRMVDAAQVQLFVQRLWNNDINRAKKRSLVRGLVDGNPPYKPLKLKEANRADAANVNWGTGRTYMEAGAGAFYDLFSEAPGFVNIQVGIGPPDKKLEWGRIMSAEADRILSNDHDWDFDIQCSINEMTLQGTGPLMFEDCFKVLPISVLSGDLKVPEMTRATTSRWEVCTVDVNYYPPQLYEFIMDEAAATQAGWNVEFTKRVIERAVNVRDPNGRTYSWEWYQQKLKNNSLEFVNDSKVCKLAFVFWKEFDGRITQVIVERQGNNTDLKTEFLFRHIGWYEDFKQAIHPFYFDRGNGGYHHSVTGLGVKMYGAMEYENRLLCNLMDKAFAPKIFFKVASPEAKEKMQIQRFGDYGVLPAGTEAVQNPIQGFLTDGLAMWRASGELMQSNLSGYRQQVPTKTGNPVTARQAMIEASQQASLSKTNYSRYYKQMDTLYAEIVRRLCLLNSPDKRSREFKENCMAKGVPREAFGRVEKVEAVRVIGQGSGFLRSDAVGSVAQLAGSLPEDGRNNWLDDFISAHCGQSAVARYNPRPAQPMASDQQAECFQWIGLAKVGTPPVITSSQDASVYATNFLKACGQALESLQQGGDPHQVLAFLQILGPAIAAHLQRFAGDVTRKALHDALVKQWKDLAKVTDKLQASLEGQAQQQKQQQAKVAAELNDQQLKTMKVQHDIQLKNLKTKAQLDTQAQKTRQQLALADAQTASAISREHARQANEMQLKTHGHLHDAALAEREMALKEGQASQSSESSE